MEGKQVQQIFVRGACHHGKLAKLLAIGAERLNRPQTGNVAEQFGNGVRLRRVRQRAHLDFKLALPGLQRRRSRCRSGHRHGHSGHRFCHRGRRQGLARCQVRNPFHQVTRGGGRAGVTGLVARQQAARGIGGLQQHIDHLGIGLQLMAAQAVQQGLHLVRQLCHIRKAEGGSPALDRMCATEDAVELLVIGGFQVQVEQHRLHQVQVLARLFKEDLVELAQIDVAATGATVLMRFGHGLLLRIAFL